MGASLGVFHGVDARDEADGLGLPRLLYERSAGPGIRRTAKSCDEVPPSHLILLSRGSHPTTVWNEQCFASQQNWLPMSELGQKQI
jgi:hypothetical protein